MARTSSDRLTSMRTPTKETHPCLSGLKGNRNVHVCLHHQHDMNLNKDKFIGVYINMNSDVLVRCAAFKPTLTCTWTCGHGHKNRHVHVCLHQHDMREHVHVCQWVHGYEDGHVPTCPSLLYTDVDMDRKRFWYVQLFRHSHGHKHIHVHKS
jgi:hypothetical protein